MPETLPCPVHLDPGLKFGKCVRTQCLMDALRRRADYYAEPEAMMTEQRAEHDAWIAEVKAMLGSGFRNLSQPVDPQIAEYEKVMLQAGNPPSKCSLRDGIEAIRNSGIPVDVDKIQSECEAGNHTEQHLDMVVHSGDDNEKADCRLPFDQWLSQQNEPIDVDCGCVTTEAFYHWLRVAYEAGNSPVTPDGWVPVSDRMPDKLIPVMVMYADGEMWSAMWSGQFWDDGCTIPDPHSITHWREMPAAPQQEVKP
ncbi:DUF551 domain-containing protein [Citrobacter freundii]